MQVAITFLFMGLLMSLDIVWIEKAPLPRGRAGGAAGLLGDDLVLAGGTLWDKDVKRWLDSVLMYNTSSNQWRIGPHLPTRLAYGGYTVTQYGFEIFGGNDGNRNHRECWALAPAKNRWTKTDTLPDDRLFAGTAQVDKSTYLLGGCRSYSDLTQCGDSVLVRDPAKGWHPISKIPNGAVSMSGVAVARRKIYVFGGCWMPSPNNLLDTNAAYMYDPSRNSWKRIRDLPAASRGASVVVLTDRYLLLLGGTRPSPTAIPGKPSPVEISRSVIIYDTDADTYRDATPLPVGLVGTDFFFHRNTLYGAGGEDGIRGRSVRLFAGHLEIPGELLKGDLPDRK
jgi:hypothetical protein